MTPWQYICRRSRYVFPVVHGFIAANLSSASGGICEIKRPDTCNKTENLSLLSSLFFFYITWTVITSFTPWASFQPHYVAGSACAGNAGNISPSATSKATASKRSQHASRHVHHARAAMHIEIANPRWRGKRSPGKTFPAHAQPAILGIWQGAHLVLRSTPLYAAPNKCYGISLHTYDPFMLSRDNEKMSIFLYDHTLTSASDQLLYSYLWMDEFRTTH